MIAVSGYLRGRLFDQAGGRSQVVGDGRVEDRDGAAVNADERVVRVPDRCRSDRPIRALVRGSAIGRDVSCAAVGVPG